MGLCLTLLAGLPAAVDAQLRTAPRPVGIDREVAVSPGGSAEIYLVGLRGGQNPASLDRIDITISPLAAPMSAGLAQSDFTQLRLVESTNRTLGDADDVLLNTVPSGSIAISGITQVSANGNALVLQQGSPQGDNNRYYFIVADMAPGAVNGHAFRLGTADGHILTSTPESIGDGFAADNRDHVVVGQLIPVIGVNPVALAFGSLNVNSSLSLPLTVSNTGAADLVVSSIASTNGQFVDDIRRAFTVAPGGSQVVNVTFTPTAIGLQSANLDLTHNAPTAGSVTTVPMTGTGLSPLITVTPTSLSFGNVLLNTPTVLTVTVSNTGNANLTVSSITSSNGRFVPSPTSFTVTPGNSQTVNVTFTPTALGAQSGTLTVVHNDLVNPSPRTVSLTGTGINPVILLSTATLAFGNVQVGTTSSLPLTVSNTGTSNLVVSNVSSDNARFTADVTSFTVVPGGNQIVNVTFAPIAIGAQNGTLTLTHNASGGSSTVALSGTGATAVIGLAPGSLAFGNVPVGTPSTLALTVSNTGTATLNVTNITSSDGHYVATPTTFTVAGGGSQVVNVTFTPTATGALPASLSIVHNAAGSPSSVPLSGTGVASGFSLSPGTLSFGSVLVGAAPSLALTITNTGGVALDVTNITSDNARFAPDATVFQVAAGGSRVVNVTFSPLATGVQSGILTITHTAVGSPATVSMSGTGVQPQITVSPNSLAFGSALVGASSALAFVVSNPGTATLNVSNTTSTDGQFVASPTAYAVAPGSSQTVTVTFTPSSTGVKAATLSITHNAAGSPSSVTLGGTGVAPSFGVAPGALAFGNVNVGTSSALALTVSNTGTAPLTVTSLSSSNSQFVPDLTAFTVAAGGNQVVNVTFTPTAAAAVNGVLTFVHDASGSPAAVNAGGTGISPTFSPTASTLNFGSVKVGNSSTQSFTVSNPGNAPLTVTNISSSDGHFAVTTPTAFTIAAGGPAQTVTVRFTPTDNVAYSGTLTLVHNAPGSPASIALVATGGDPEIRVTPESLDYGNVVYGQSASVTVTVTNPGSATLTVTDVSASDVQYTAVPASFTVNPGSSQTVTVTFAASIMGSASGFLFFSHNASGDFTGIPISASATVSLNAYALYYGIVSSDYDSTLTVVISNPSAADVTITSAVSDSRYFAPKQSSFVVHPGVPYNLDVTFRPTNPGQYSAHLRLTHNPTIVVSLTGWSPSTAQRTTSPDKRKPFEVPFGGEVLLVLAVGLYGLFRRAGRPGRGGPS